jgi:hypothetical protein
VQSKDKIPYPSLKFLFIPLVLLIGFSGLAQSELYEEPVIIYSNQTYGGLNLHSNGAGAFLNFGKYRTAKKIMIFGFDVLYLKHEKEIKSYNPVYDDARSYVLGKMNNFYMVRPGIGVERILTEKLRKSGVQVSYTWQVGPTLGITKPVYLEIAYPGIAYDYLVVERYNPDAHYSNNIYGKASGLNGLDELKIHPGAFVKFAFQFEYSNEKNRLKGLEAGMVVDAFPQDIPILAEKYEQNKQLFFNFYLNLFIGQKYIKR